MKRWLDEADPTWELRMRVSWGEQDSRPLPPGSSSGGGDPSSSSVVVLRGRPAERPSSSSQRGSRLRVSQKFRVSGVRPRAALELPVQPRSEGELWNSSDDEEGVLARKQELLDTAVKTCPPAIYPDQLCGFPVF